MFVLLAIPIARALAGLRGEVTLEDFRYGESATVPPRVSLFNRNYMNLLEQPLLFYVACLLLSVTGGATAATLSLAWTYVGLRVLHSVIHLSYNNVPHRMAAFAASSVVLAAMWIAAALHLRA